MTSCQYVRGYESVPGLHEKKCGAAQVHQARENRRAPAVPARQRAGPPAWRVLQLFPPARAPGEAPALSLPPPLPPLPPPLLVDLSQNLSDNFLWKRRDGGLAQPP